MITALFLIGFMALVVAVGLFFIPKAPIGYEDETGFHFGSADGRVSTIASSSREKAAPHPIFLPFPWAKPALRLAALVMMLFVISPSDNPNHNPKSSGQVSTGKQQLASLPGSAETIFNLSESSKLFPTLCQRFSQIE
jgi:hypothetical protein